MTKPKSQFTLTKQFLNAARRGSVKRMQTLLEQGADLHAYDDEALRRATIYSAEKAVRFLLDKGLDPNAFTAYGQDSDSGTALEWAVTEPNGLGTVRMLLDAGADQSRAGYRALNHAVREGFNDIVDLLIERGGDVLQVTEDTLTLIKTRNPEMVEKIEHLQKQARQKPSSQKPKGP